MPILPISRIDTLQTPEPTELAEQNFHESTRREDAEAEEECLREAEEECLREETRLVEDIERFRNRVNSDCELRDKMRQRSGPADLRNSNLNRETDTRELMRPRAGPSDLRYSKLQPEKDLRDLMKPKLKPMDTVDGRWTMDEAPSASALSAISTYESEEEQEELPAYDTTPRRQRPLCRVDLRSKLEEEPVFPDRTSQSRSSRTNPENPLHTAYLS